VSDARRGCPRIWERGKRRAIGSVDQQSLSRPHLAEHIMAMVRSSRHRSIWVQDQAVPRLAGRQGGRPHGADGSFSAFATMATGPPSTWESSTYHWPIGTPSQRASCE